MKETQIHLIGMEESDLQALVEKSIHRNIGSKIDRILAHITKEQGEEIFTVKQVSKMLGVHTETLRLHIREGYLECKKAGRKYIITKAQLDSYLSYKGHA
ncbi:helix-turn-helix domain-containing protein [Aquimarina algiphila]|uniref:Helix-turn-helix domain-containing protein n=1 Tax=Aquimarina algiphila TaxID=2047982 RepID=A0A554VRM0_9FLAO|nr:helix-turn-helix domain-containing protein [Aquimarina algiphila]TSE11268.1 helix-turn-helix domain-containing protein [Aquimarina algiphila]